MHPYEEQVSSDIYFIKLSNRFLDITDNIFKKEISNKTKRTIALSVAAYFEDVISGLGLWQGFTKKHFAMYGKYLPFYRLTENYIPEEINPEDISFLIWSIVQHEILESRETIVNPENIAITTLSIALFSIIDEEYETALENEMLQSLFTEGIDYDDFYAFRSVALWLYYESYLIAPYTEGQLEEALDAENRHKEHGEIIAYAAMNELIFKNPCGPLALKIHEWMAAIVGEDTDLGNMLLQTKFNYKSPRTYLVKDKNEAGMILLSCDSDKPIFLSKETMQEDMHAQPGHAIFGNLVYYNGKWELNGFMMDIPRDEYDRNRDEFRKKAEGIDISRRIFLKANKRKPVRYFKNDKELKEFFNNAYSLEKKIDKDVLKKQKNLIAFSSVENGVATISDIAVYIKDKDNPCYDSEEAQETGLALFAGYDLFQELIEYLVKNNLIPDLKLNSIESEKRGRELAQENLDFMFRFFQPLSYM